MADIGPDTMPEEFDGPLVAVGGGDAGAAEFEKTGAGMTGQEGSNILLRCSIEPFVKTGNFLS